MTYGQSTVIWLEQADLFSTPQVGGWDGSSGQAFQRRLNGGSNA